jgi:hypothetical protein
MHQKVDRNKVPMEAADVKTVVDFHQRRIHIALQEISSLQQEIAWNVEKIIEDRQLALDKRGPYAAGREDLPNGGE